MAGSAILRHLLNKSSEHQVATHNPQPTSHIPNSALSTEHTHPTSHNIPHPTAHGTQNLVVRTHAELDLTDQQAVREFFEKEKPDQIYLAAAKVGGIHANNTFPAEFIYRNLMMEANVIHEAWRAGVKKLLFLGSSCIYPKQAPQPMRESALLTGPLEPTNEPYAIAKIAGIKLCESYNRQYGTDYRSVMPTNLYGPGDNYHPENSHVIPALIRRFHEAKQAMESGSSPNSDTHHSALSTEKTNIPQPTVHSPLSHSVKIWGTGTPRREFLYVDDMAAASVHVMNLDKATYDARISPMQSHINVGFGEDITIRELAETVAKVTGYKGKIEYDPEKPDGTQRKLMDSSLLRSLGWQPKTGLEEGLMLAYADFLESGT